MNAHEYPTDPDDDTASAGGDVSPWLDDEGRLGEYWGPPATREVLNRWLDEVMSVVRDLLESSQREDPNLTIESVELEGEYPDVFVVVLFRDARRPGCRFEYDWPVGRTAASGVVDNPAVQIWANFDETRSEALPDKDGHPDTITWLSTRG